MSSWVESKEFDKKMFRLFCRILLLARDYSKKRSCFGSNISEYPLHINTLADMELECRAGTALLFELVRILGLQEVGKSTEEEDLLLRLLTPIAKLFTAKRSMGVVSEGLECFGGQGYIEDTGLPSILRNNQVKILIRFCITPTHVLLAHMTFVMVLF